MKIKFGLRLIGAGIGSTLCLLLIIFGTLRLNRFVAFQSLESVTEKGAPVFNEIALFPGFEKDTWMMRQSHHGYDDEKRNWDRLAIVVDKTKTPYFAKFYQFPPGELNPQNLPKPIPFKARCIACHVGGPRAIRPDTHARTPSLKLLDQLLILAWNLRIKSYGRVINGPGMEFTTGSQFKSKLKILSQPLGLHSCTKCHSDHGIRGALKLAHLGTARYMLKNGIMPPFPFQALPGEIDLLNRMIKNSSD